MWAPPPNGWYVNGVRARIAAGVIFVRGLRTVTAATAGTLSLAEPLVAALLAIGLLGERPSVAAAIGILLLLGGLFVTSLTTADARRSEVAEEPAVAPASSRS